MRLLARFWSLPRVWRHPGRRPLAVVFGLVGVALTALVMSAAFSDSVPAPPSGPTVVARAASATVALIGEPRRGEAAHYDRIARDRLRAGTVTGFLPLYREAERVHGVNWRLIASVHSQETAFSKSPSTYRGLNDFGCCAGPMQFNVTNGPVSTWKSYRNSFRAGRRPERYPHRTRSHPSIYDDFDAIMAAGSLLEDSGAGRSLDLGAWQAAYAYYGHDLYGITYASQVLARAVAWERDGFCPNCALDEGLVAEFDDAYGLSERQQLIGDEKPRKKKKRSRRARDKKGEREERDARRKRREAKERAARRPPVRRRPVGPPAARKKKPAQPAPPPAVTPPPPTTTPSPPPPPEECPLLRKLVGCKPPARSAPPP